MYVTVYQIQLNLHQHLLRWITFIINWMELNPLNWFYVNWDIFFDMITFIRCLDILDVVRIIKAHKIVPNSSISSHPPCMRSPRAGMHTKKKSASASWYARKESIFSPNRFICRSSHGLAKGPWIWPRWRFGNSSVIDNHSTPAWL